jgi:DNA helicase-2/ATP-dependent DNA helicase PcrA
MRSLGNTKELEEERRLAYVGITRAREKLFVTRAQVRSSWGAPAYNPQSRFLEELPPKLVEWEGLKKEALAPASRTPVRSGLTSTFGKKAGVVEREVPSLAVGDRVTHDKFGLGTVVETGGASAKDAWVSVDFGTGDKKRLLLRYAPVEKL